MAATNNTRREKSCQNFRPTLFKNLINDYILTDTKLLVGIFDVVISAAIDGLLNPTVDVGCPNTLFCALNPNGLLAT